MHPRNPPSPSHHPILQSCKTIHHLPQTLTRLVIAGLLPSSFVLRHVVEILSRSPDHPSSLLLSHLLSRHHFPRPSAFLYNRLIRAFSRTRRPQESLAFFASMLRNASRPDPFTFPSLAKANSSQTHTQALKRGFESHNFTVNALLSIYSESGDMDSARKLFDSSCEALDVVSWNTILNGHLKSGETDLARRVFDAMPIKNGVSWTTMISGYVANGDLDLAQALFDRMPDGISSVVASNSMVSGFARHGLLPLARKVFDEMPIKNAASWNSMVSGYASNGKMDSAMELFDLMPERNVVSWSCMISGYAKSNRSAEALRMFRRMIQTDVKPNEVTMVGVLSAIARLSALDRGKWAHAYIDENHLILDDDHNLGAALIDMYSKCGSLETAMGVFRSLIRRNVSSWNSIITGLAINGASSVSLDYFKQMCTLGVKPDDITFLAVLTACTHRGLVNEGRQYFESMSKDHGIRPGIKHYGCMVDLLGRAGLLEEAEGIIRSMPMKPDAMILSALLSACRTHRDLETAERVRRDFIRMEQSQAGCHLLLSNIYAAAGRWADASEIRSLTNKRRIKEPGYSSVEF